MTKPNIKCIDCRKDLYRSPVKLKRGLIPLCQSCFGRKNAIKQNQENYKSYITKYKNKEVNGSAGKPYLLSAYVRKYIKEKYNNSCSKCNWNKINPKTGNVPVQINHIDGNSSNHLEENLELLCPNCHSLTENYMNLNRGNGRKERYKKESLDNR